MEFPQFVTIPSTGAKIPIVGFGSGTKWQWKKKGEKGGPEQSKYAVDDDLVDTLVTAFKHGFVHLDTAEIYTTRRDIGAAIKKLNVPRESFWLTDKYHGLGTDAEGNVRGPIASLKEGLEWMNVPYVDLFLIHTAHFEGDNTVESCWKEMEQLYKIGLAKNIGVSNFDIENLEKVLAICEIQPAVCQVEFDPYLQNQSPGLQTFLKKHNILLEAYGPCIPLTKAPDGPLKELLPKLAKKYGRSETQILLKWVHQQGYVSMTTTSRESRMDDIMQVFTLELSDEDMKAITDAGNSYFFRAFPIPPLPKYDEELKKERGLLTE